MPKKNNIFEGLDKLNDQDTMSLLLFALYKMKDIPEYSTLSELVYTLNKDSLIDLLSVFGGITIRIPTVKELKMMVYGLMAYLTVNLDGMSFEEALKALPSKEISQDELRKSYISISEALKDYEFKGIQNKG